MSRMRYPLFGSSVLLSISEFITACAARFPNYLVGLAVWSKDTEPLPLCIKNVDIPL